MIVKILVDMLFFQYKRIFIINFEHYFFINQWYDNLKIWKNMDWKESAVIGLILCKILKKI